MTLTATPPSRSLVLHPFFFGLFPLFSWLSANLVWAAFHEAFLPAVAVLAIAGVLWLALWPVLPDAPKRGLVISLFWLPFFGYGATMDFVRERLNFHEMLSFAQVSGIGVVLLLIGAGLLYALHRSAWTFAPLTTFLNRLSAILLVLALGSCFLAVARQQSAPDHAAAEPVRLSPEKLATLPNIYFIICDAYPRADYLQDYFAFDNTPFLNELRERGFYVVDRSRSNYCNTLLSLGSTLNLDFHDPAIVPLTFSENYPVLIPLVQDNLVVRTLRAHNYEFVAIESAMFPTKFESADRYIRPGAFNRTEYQQSVIDMTPVRSILNRMKQLRSYQFVPFTLDALEAVRSGGRPMFVFAHMIAPHRPHAYDENGNFVEHFPPYKEGWRTVTKFLNKRLIQVVDAIQANEPNSIIIIQGDHGSNSSMHGTVSNWEGDWHDYVRSRSANLSTCYLPGKSYEGLFYPELTSVNLFRILFDTYLDTSYGKLEDATWITPQQGGALMKVTEVH